MTTNCPSGHTCRIGETGTPVCDECDLIATWWNARTGEVFTWTDQEEHHEACRSLQDQMDGAFDNQYFGGGW